MLWWMLLLFFFQMTDGNSFIHEAIPFSIIGFFNDTPIVLINCFAIGGLLSVNRELLFFLLTFTRLRKTELKKSSPRSMSILIGFRFDVDGIFENSFVYNRPDFLFKRLHQV